MAETGADAVAEAATAETVAATEIAIVAETEIEAEAATVGIATIGADGTGTAVTEPW